MAMKLGMIVSVREQWPAVIATAVAARAKGEEVAIFAMADAVEVVGHDAAGKPVATALAELAEVHDAEVTFCATSLDHFAATAPAGAKIGSQLDHAELLRKSDRVVAFT